MMDGKESVCDEEGEERTMPPFCLSGPAAVCALVMLPFCTFAACWVINAASRVTGIPAVPGENVVLGIVVSSIIGAISAVSVWRWIVSGGKYVRIFASVVLALFGLAVLIAVETSEMGWENIVEMDYSQWVSARRDPCGPKECLIAVSCAFLVLSGIMWLPPARHWRSREKRSNK